MRIRSILLCLLLSPLIVSCVSPNKHLKTPPTAWEQSLTHQLKMALEEHNQKITSLQTLALVKVKAPFHSKSGQAILLVDKKYGVKIQALDDFGQPHDQYVLTTDDFYIYDSLYQVWIHKDSDALTLKEEFFVDVTPREFISLLMGRIPLHEESYRAAAYPRKEPYKSLRLIGRTIEVKLDPKSLLPQVVTLKNDFGDERAVFEFGYDPQSREPTLPHTIKVGIARSESHLEITYHEPVANARLDKRLFRLDITPSAPMEILP